MLCSLLVTAQDCESKRSLAFMNDFDENMSCFVCQIPKGANDIWASGSERTDCRRLSSGKGSANAVLTCVETKWQIVCENLARNEEQYFKLTGIVGVGLEEDPTIVYLSKAVTEKNLGMDMSDENNVLGVLHPKMKIEMDKNDGLDTAKSRTQNTDEL